MKKLLGWLVLFLGISGYVQAADVCSSDKIPVKLYYEVMGANGEVTQASKIVEYEVSTLQSSPVLDMILRRTELKPGEPLPFVAGTPRVFDMVLMLLNDPTTPVGGNIQFTLQNVQDIFILTDYFNPLPSILLQDALIALAHRVELTDCEQSGEYKTLADLAGKCSSQAPDQVKRMFLIAKMFLGISPSWDQVDKTLVNDVFRYALHDQRKATLAFLCMDIYPQLIGEVFEDGLNPFIEVIRNQGSDSLVILETMLRVAKEQGLDVLQLLNKQDVEGNTALFYGIYMPVIQAWLLQQGADVNIKNNAGETAVTRAYMLLVPEAIRNVPLPNVNDPDQRRHLLVNLEHAVERADVEAVKTLLALGLHPDEFAPDNRNFQYDRISITALQRLTGYSVHSTVTVPELVRLRTIVEFILTNYPDINLESRFNPGINYYSQAIRFAPSEEIRNRLQADKGLSEQRRGNITEEQYNDELQERMIQPERPERSWADRLKNWWQNR